MEGASLREAGTPTSWLSRCPLERVVMANAADERSKEAETDTGSKSHGKAVQ